LPKRDRAGFTAAGLKKQKFFAPLFYKKAAAFLFPLSISGSKGAEMSTQPILFWKKLETGLK
jgi:hypothetical protein